MAKRKKKARRRKSGRRASSAPKRTRKRRRARVSNPVKRRRRRASGRRRSRRRSNPGNPGNPRRAKRRSGRRRRRNPGLFSKKSPIVSALVAAAAGIGTAVAVGIGGAMIAPSKPIVRTAIALGGAVAGAFVMKKHPAIGGAMIAGSGGVAAIPIVEEKVLGVLGAPKGMAAIATFDRAGNRIGAIIDVAVDERGNRIGAILDSPSLEGITGPDDAPYDQMTPWGRATA